MPRFRQAILVVWVAHFAYNANAQLPSDNLRLWLKADSLNVAEGARVNQWVDSSSYGTIFAPRTTTEPNGPLGGFPVEEYPHLQTVSLNGRDFPSVRFDRDGDIANRGDPAVDRSGSTDRMFQVNNRMPGGDPLAIGDGTSVTTFSVFKPDVTTAGSLGFQAIWAKRGNSASLLELGIRSTGHFNYVTYDAVTDYRTTNPGIAGKWQILAQTITENGANDPLKFLFNDTEIGTNPLIQNPTFSNGGVIADRNDSINEDPAGMTEPFALGGHAQDCCGEGETFAGNIAEVIIYARALSASEMDQVYSYLTAKYLNPPLAVLGDYNEDQVVDAADYTVWRDNFGQFYALANENPAALTEGFVDQEDIDFWKQNFGANGGSGSEMAGSVPEPSGIFLALIAFPATLRRRR